MSNKAQLARRLLESIFVSICVVGAISLAGGTWAGSSGQESIQQLQQGGDSYLISDAGPTPTTTPSLTVSVTVDTNPAGRLFVVDGVNYNSLQAFSWVVGSVHTLSTTSPQGTGQVRYLWNSWSDGGEQTHTVMPTVPSTFTANFTTRYLLNMCCNSEFGTVSPPTGFFDAGQSVQISATANIGIGLHFERWAGNGNGSYSGFNNPATVVMNGPIHEYAIFEGNPPVSPPPTPTPTPGPTSSPTVTPTPTPTQTLWVNTVVDIQDKLAGDGFCLDEAGVCSLRAAITEANAFAGSTVIVLPAGIYTQSLAGAPEDANSSGDWDITSRILIQGGGSANTIIQANTMPDTATERVMHILNGAVVNIDGVTIRNGKHLFVSIADPGGGGVDVEDSTSSLALNDVIVESNISEGSGGGIRMGTRGARLTISNSAIRNNRAGSGVVGSTAAGGGIDIDGTVPTGGYSIHRITNATIQGNVVSTSVASASGGGISVTSGDELYCIRCTITDNQSTSTAGGSLEGFAGGLYNENSYIDCSQCRVTGNSASHLAGGIRVFHPPNGSGTLGLLDSTVSNNSAPSVGGIMNTGAALLIGRSTISGNIASDSKAGIAGGIYNARTALGGTTVFLFDSTISGNRAAYGGGIFNEGPIQRVSANFSTIASNTATIKGGGLLQDIAIIGTTYLKNTIIADNESPTGPDLHGAFTSENYNHIENLAGSTINLRPNDVTGVDPNLGELGFYGGHTRTHLPQRNSPVLNQIPLFTNQCNNNLNTDQRELPRLEGERCDKGSVEIAPGDHRESTPFDYDGDGRTDLSVFRPSDGVWYLNKSTEGFFGMLFGFGTDRIVPADFDGDGKTDIAVFRPSDQRWYIANSSDGTYRTEVFGLADDLPAPGDYDGDGKADLCVFRPSDGTWYLQRSSDGSFLAYQFGAANDKPTVGDFDGDGKSDFAVFRTTNGEWYQAYSSDGSIHGERFGFSTDKLAYADYDGDGKTDLAVFRPSEGKFFIRKSATATYNGFLFGLAGDIPAPGNYDGDGRADLSVFRPSDGNWYRQNSSNGSYFAYNFGLSGDIPTPTAFH